MQPLVSASREELDIELLVKKGQIPTDIYGHVFVNSSVGSVNSNGLPYPKTTDEGKANQEYSSPVMNGDSMVFRFDFDEIGKVKLKSRILKTPSYYADLATKQGEDIHKIFGFRNMGISRLSFALGARDMLSTALIPFRMKDDTNSRIVATSDLGRPFEIDVNTLEVITPIGTNKEWKPATPPFIHWVFPLYQSTAHPSFGAKTQELFMVNFIKDSKNITSSLRLVELLTKKEDIVKEELHQTIKECEGMDRKEAIEHLQHFYSRPEVDEKGKSTIFQNILFWIKEQIQKLIKKETQTEAAVFLLKWNGSQELQKWELINEDGTPINIIQCMHQTGLSKDYIILIDASFKIALDILLNNPFPNEPEIDKVIRFLTAGEQLPYTNMYIVKRADLKEGASKVKVKTVQIPIETIHFSPQYPNPNGQITLFTANNAAACLAEWVRYYDKIVDSPKDRPIDKGTAGILAVGEMDVSRMGKLVIDVKQEKFVEEKIIYKLGNNVAGEKTGVHTWGVGLHTYRDIISDTETNDSIKNIYWQCSGLENRRLTRFIYNLYKDYQNRVVSLDDLKKYTEQEIPLTLTRLDTEKMELVDFYEFPRNCELRSLQFIPRKREPNEDVSNIDLSTDGYILCTMINGQEVKPDTNYEREIWIFDAADLQKGAVCVLDHPSLIYFFTLHSVWLPKLGENTSSYKISVREDYEKQVEKTIFKHKRERLDEFMEEKVYPYFE
ncbi:carotenoid oxygenase family protein [Bernardetia sp. OM2101]|uniref:carotenoid oxygenase family protein n=1 Tax=Bernardetia sp. OM2101 TaxID=3344876 RepID=UPI0035D04C18